MGKLGQFMARLIRGYGKVRCVVPSMSTSVDKNRPGLITIGFQLSFHNDKELPIGIYNPTVVLYKAGTLMVHALIIEEENGNPAIAGKKPSLRFIDLPSRRWVHKRIYFEHAMQHKPGLDWTKQDDQITKLL